MMYNSFNSNISNTRDKLLTKEWLYCCRANMMSDERVETKRYIKRIQQEAKERELDERISRAEQERILKQKQLEQEEKLAQVKSWYFTMYRLF